MLTVSDELKNAFMKSERTIYVRIKIGNRTFDNDNVVSVEYDSGSLSGEVFAIGSTYSNSIKITFSELVEGLKELDEVSYEIGIKLSSGSIEYVPMGIFIINDAIGMDRNNNKTTIECMDRMIMMGGTYVSSLTYPAAIREVALEIANKSGLVVDSTSFERLSADKIAKPEGYNYREAIGLIAQFEAGFATFNRYGKLEIRTLSDSSFAIPPDNYFSKGLVKNEIFFRLGGISCTTDDGDTIIQSGNSAGNQVVLENRVMTKVLLDKTYQKIQMINYYPFSLSWQGNPVIEAGDWVEVEDLQGNKFKTPNLNYSLSFNGGLSAKSSAETVTQSDITYQYKSPLQQKIEWIHARIDAAGGNVVYEGIDEPTNPKEGDLWFKVIGPDKEILIYREREDGTLFWDPQISTADINKIAKELELIIKQADKDRTKAEEDFEAAKQTAKEYTDTQIIAFDTKFEAETGAIRNEVTVGYNNAIANGKAYTDNKSAEFNTQLNLVKADVASTVLKANDSVTKADKAIADVGFLKPDVATAKANAATAVQNAVTASQNAQTALNSIETLTQEVDVSITNINGELTRKVSQATFNTLSGTVGTHTTQISQTQTALSAKAESSLVNTIKGTVDTHTTQIKVVSDGLELKAESSLVNTVKGTVDSHTTQINANSTAITARLTSAQIETLLTGKQYINQTTLNATSNGLTAQIIQVSTELSNLDVNDRNLYPNSGNFTSVLGWAGTTTIEQKDGFSTLKTLGTGYPSTAGAIQILDPDTEYIVTAEFMFDTAFTTSNTVPVHLYVYTGSATGGMGAATGLEIVGGNRTIQPNVWETISVRFKTIPSTTPINFKFHLYTGTTAITKWLKYVKVQKGMRYTGWSPKVEEVATLEKVVTIEANINGIQATVANKAEQSQVTQLAGQLTSKVDSTTYSSKMTQLDSAINLRVTQTAVTEAILLDKKIKDTRSANELPSWYFANYPQQTVEEFKYRATIGVTGAEQFGQLTTKVPWSGSSGGAITQIFSSKDGVFQRTSNALGTAWLAWDQVAETGKLVTQINLSTEGVLIQGKVIQLDGDVRMLQAFINKLDVQTLNAVNANIASIRTNMLTADVITSTHLKVDNAMMDKITASTAVVNYLFTKTAFVDNLNAKTLTAITANITSIRSQILIANVVQATHLQADAATITKLFATDANVNVLTAKTAFINSVKAIDIAADRITAGTLNAALVNIINLNASKISTGTITGANSDWNLNTGIMNFANPASGDVMSLDQGEIRFKNGAQGRYLKYQSEGLLLQPFASNTGTSKNTALHLIGGGPGSYQYIQFVSQDLSGVNMRLEAEGQNMTAYHGLTGSFIVAKYGDIPASGTVITGAYETRHSTGVSLRIAGDSISTPRDGSRNIYLTPQGTGSVVSGAANGTRYTFVASDFVKQSSRDTKTNIIPLESGLDNIRQLRPVSYNKIDKLNRGIFEIEKGFIAEDSLMVATVDGKGIYDSHITAYLVKAVQELDVRTASETDQLKEEIGQLKTRIQKLESAA